MTASRNSSANKQIFRVAIQKARDHGFTHFVGDTEEDFARFLTQLADDRIDGREMWAAVLYDNCFCRAFWGTEYVIPIVLGNGPGMKARYPVTSRVAIGFWPPHTARTSATAPAAVMFW